MERSTAKVCSLQCSRPNTFCEITVKNERSLTALPVFYLSIYLSIFLSLYLSISLSTVYNALSLYLSISIIVSNVLCHNLFSVWITQHATGRTLAPRDLGSARGPVLWRTPSEEASAPTTQAPQHPSTPAPQHPSPGSPLPLAAAPSVRCCRRERRSPRSDGPQLSVSWALSLTREPLESLSLTPRHTLCIFPSLFALGIKKNEGVIISNKKKDSFEQQ